MVLSVFEFDQICLRSSLGLSWRTTLSRFRIDDLRLRMELGIIHLILGEWLILER
jgi:hypothetical protein